MCKLILYFYFLASFRLTDDFLKTPFYKFIYNLTKESYKGKVN